MTAENDILGDLAKLSPESQGLALAILDQLALNGSSGVLDSLYDADYARTPPTIAEFIDDEYYMGAVCRPEPAIDYPGLFDCWRSALLKDLAPGSSVQQIVMSGPIGNGKSFCGSLILLFMAAQVLCMRDPLRYFGLAPTSTITFSFFSVTQKQVFGGAFSDALKMMRQSPFFRERVDASTKLDDKFSGRRVVLDKSVVIEAGSRLHEALGRNVYCSLIDEINFRLEADAAKAAEELIAAIDRRRASRFANRPGMLIIISSAKLDSDFLVEHTRRNRNNPAVRVYDWPWWEGAGKHKVKFSGKNFLVDMGDAVTSPRIIDDELVAVHVPAARLIHIPVELRKHFEIDLPGSIRDIAGRSTGRSSKLFSNEMPLLGCISDDLRNPFPTATLRLSAGMGGYIHEHLVPNTLLKVQGGKLVPARHPRAPRCLHLDMSTGAQDALGFVMLHPSGEQRRVVSDLPAYASRSSEYAPVFEVDAALRIVRHPGGDVIDFSRIRHFILWLRAAGFDIRMVSCDLLHLSAEMRSLLTQQGFTTAYTSVDKAKWPYVQLKQTVLEGRLRFFDHDYLYTELANLEDHVEKVDHPDKFPPCRIEGIDQLDLKGSKDLTDGLAGALLHAAAVDLNIPIDFTQQLEAMRAAVAMVDPNLRKNGWLGDEVIQRQASPPTF